MTPSTPDNDLRDRIAMMRKLEATRYACSGYVKRYYGSGDPTSKERNSSGEETGDYREPIRRTGSPDTVCDFSGVSSSKRCASSTASGFGRRISPSVRIEMCDWFYRVVDHVGIHREVVSVAWSFVDRFLDITPNCTTKPFKLCCMVALSLAAKLSGYRMLSHQFLLRLTRGEYNEHLLAHAETALLKSLKWYVHPPTAAWYVRELMSLVSDVPTARAIEDSSLYFTELAVFEWTFVTKNPSEVAFASILNALEKFDSRQVQSAVRSSLIEDMSRLLNISPDSTEIKLMQRRLWDLCSGPAETPNPDAEQPATPSPATADGKSNLARCLPSPSTVATEHMTAKSTGQPRTPRRISYIKGEISGQPTRKRAKAA